MRQLTIKDIQRRLLNIAVEVNRICEEHGIPLFMISGTMLGAIRHKGFIPWDDDMDFAVPYDHFFQLIELLKRELPRGLRCLSLNDSETYKCPWIKVEDRNTRVIDNSLYLIEDQLPGLTIDIFPLVSCQKEDSGTYVRQIQSILRTKRLLFSKSNSRLKNWLKFILRLFSVHSAEALNDRIIKIMNVILPGDYYVIPVDPNYYNKFFPASWFNPLTKFAFEDKVFFGINDYDSYLQDLYHDYMKLPPLSQRRVHASCVYLIQL